MQSAYQYAGLGERPLALTLTRSTRPFQLFPSLHSSMGGYQRDVVNSLAHFQNLHDCFHDYIIQADRLNAILGGQMITGGR